MQSLVFEGAGHSMDFFGYGTDLQREGTPRGGRHRHLLQNQSCFRKGKCEVICRGFKQINLAGAVLKIDIRREDPRLEIGRNGVQVVSRRKRPPRSIEPKKSMVAQVVVDIGNEDIERHASIQGMSVLFRLRAVAGQSIHHLRVAPDLTVLRSEQGHCGKEGNAAPLRAIKSPRQQHGPAATCSNSCGAVTMPARSAKRRAISSQVSMLYSSDSLGNLAMESRPC